MRQIGTQNLAWGRGFLPARVWPLKYSIKKMGHLFSHSRPLSNRQFHLNCYVIWVQFLVNNPLHYRNHNQAWHRLALWRAAENWIAPGGWTPLRSLEVGPLTLGHHQVREACIVTACVVPVLWINTELHSPRLSTQHLLIGRPADSFPRKQDTYYSLPCSNALSQ